jgi:hypothetical protein
MFRHHQRCLLSALYWIRHLFSRLVHSIKYTATKKWKTKSVSSIYYFFVLGNSTNGSVGVARRLRRFTRSIETIGTCRGTYSRMSRMIEVDCCDVLNCFCFSTSVEQQQQVERDQRIENTTLPQTPAPTPMATIDTHDAPLDPSADAAPDVDIDARGGLRDVRFCLTIVVVLTTN